VRAFFEPLALSPASEVNVAVQNQYLGLVVKEKNLKLVQKTAKKLYLLQKDVKFLYLSVLFQHMQLTDPQNCDSADYRAKAQDLMGIFLKKAVKECCSLKN